MFSQDNYTVFMISMRIDKQGIPLWFRCFKDKDDPKAFNEKLLKQGISYVSNLFSDDFDLIFLADRWFNSTSWLEHINSLGHTYCVRLKRNIKVFIYDKKEGHKIWKTLDKLEFYQHTANWYFDALITDNKYSINIAVSKKKDVKEPWIIATNGEPKRAIKDYGYRFGAIECIFKNQKSNGFYLEKTCNTSLKYFEYMYTIACFSVTFMVILGSDYTKNTKSYKHISFTTHTNSNNRKIRIMSLFNVGLTLFKMAFESTIYIRIPYTFILYDL